MAAHDTWVMDPAQDAELARRVYARSWPTTCRADFSADEIIERIGSRDALWWAHTIASSPVRIAGGPSSDGLGFGFALASPEGDGWDLSYLFCEPEAFGTGLAGALHDTAVRELATSGQKVGAWILQGNLRSQRFFERRGWQCRGLRTPPWVSTARFLRYELAEDTPGLSN
jgi:GNAT superfamily N-acetyltransferase